MTVSELRQILTAIDNQDLTIKELRAILFWEDNQNAEITETEIAKIVRNNLKVANI